MTGRTILLLMLTVAASVCLAQKSDAPKPPRTPWANKLFIKGILHWHGYAASPVDFDDWAGMSQRFCIF